MILHLMIDEKFTSGFVFFINEHFNNDEHIFLVMNSKKEMRYAGSVEGVPNVIVAHKDILGLASIIKNMIAADKIILHGMFNPYIVCLLDVLSLAKKTYWCIWGGDLYDYQKDSNRWRKLKTRVISRLKAVITPLEGDYELAKVAYGAHCKSFPCLAPNTVITQKPDIESFCKKWASDAPLKILLGNSADCENRHMYLLDQLSGYSQHDIRIYMPLSYGDQKYAQEVVVYARRIFGDKVTPMFDFMPIDQYRSFLRSIDVAVFAHKRQQAFSNTIQLLSLGVKVYLDPNGSIRNFLDAQGIESFDVENVKNDLFVPITQETMERNQAKICSRCSLENLITEWDLVFNDPEK